MGNAQSTLPQVLQPPPSPGKSGANRLRNVFKNKGKQRAVTAPATSPLGIAHDPPTPPPKSPRSQPQPPAPAPAPAPTPAPQPLPRQQRPLEVDTGKKEDWRRSDATMASHHTIRPRSGTAPRPVSMAESTSTVMAHRRLSALVAEAEFVLPDDDDAQARLNTLNGTRKRHSMTLHFAASPSPTLATPPATSSAAAEGYIGAAQRDGSSHTAGSQIRGRLAAWTTASASGHGNTPPAITVDEHGGWAAPQHTGWVPQKLAREPTLVRHEPQPQAPSGMLGFGRRVVRALGMQMPGQGHDTPPSRSPTPERRGPRRTPNAPSGTWSVHTADSSMSSQSQGNSLGPCLRGPRAQSGLVFGRPLNDAVRDTAIEHVRTAMDGTLVPSDAPAFDHAAAHPFIHLHHTGFADARSLSTGENGWSDPGPSAPLTDRALPALVVRCVQHIMTWGLEEEGLFRISGRASHIARLRSEFDTGADFDLQASPPGELDPHAVASIFKAYLRELPDPILTKQLTPLFEAAMDAENETRRSIDTAASVASAPASMPTQMPMPMPRRLTLESGGCGLPSSPRPAAAAAAAAVNNSVNRPSPLSSSPASTASSPMSPPAGPIPSLTQPALAIAPPSAALLRRFRALVARLPRAHRDLLRTVSSLIRATASRKETRMPLSNLTVVFCPSLGLSPSILRVLCEQEEIWTPLSNEEIEEMRREQEVLESATSDRDGSDGSGQEIEVPEPETPVPQTPADVRAMYAINALPTSASQHTQDNDTASFALSSASSSSLATPDSNAASREELALHARRTPIHTSPSAPNLSLRRAVAPGMSIRSFSSKSSLASSNVKISGPLELMDVSSPTTSTAISFPSPTPSLGPGSEMQQFPSTVPGTHFPRTESEDDPEQPQERPFSRPLARAKRPSLTMLFGKRSLSSLRNSRIMNLSPLSPRTASQPLVQSRASDGAGTRDTVYGGSASEGASASASAGVSRRASVLDMGLSLSRRASALSRRASVMDPAAKASEERERVESAPPVLELGIETSPLRVPGMISPLATEEFSPMQTAVPEVVRRTTPPIDTAAANEQHTDTSKTEITPLGELPAPYNRLSLWEDESDAADGGLDGEWASSVLLAADAGWLGAERTASS
ncbi:unnamed protein product [Peniophora sp. CBMAI 1063]|nr:unnamed protein product [Peniophora sp. CBMAI 1063]